MESKIINRTERPKRLTPGEQRNRLTVSNLDTKNFYHRFVLDINDRIATFLLKGYTFVPKEGKTVGDKDISITDSKSSAITVSKNGQTLYLMRLPMELYLSDRADIEKISDDVDVNQRRKIKEAGDYGKVTNQSKIGGPNVE